MNAEHNRQAIEHGLPARCSSCGKKDKKLTFTEKCGWPLDLCPECLPREQGIVDGMAHHAMTGD